MREDSCRLPDGRRVSWREIGEGPVIVLIHGWAASGAVFTEMAGILGEDHRVLMPDLPGHGHSSPVTDFSLVHMAADLAIWLKSLVVPPALICGWSLGGMAAIELCVVGGYRPKGLVLMATTPRFTIADDWSFGLPAAEVRVLERNLGRDFQRTLGQFFQRMFAGEAISPERLRTIRRFAISNQPLPDPLSARACLKLFSVQDQRTLLPGVNCPVLVVHGAEDQITPVGAGRSLAEMVPQSRRIEYPATGHAPFLSHPRRVASDIRSFEQWVR